MRKFRNLSAFVVLFTALSFISCETEPVDSDLISQNPDENPGTNPDTDPGTDPGTSSGDYWPMALNNQWVFTQDGEELQPMIISSSEVVAGVTYYKVDQFFEQAGTDDLTGTAVVRLSKTGGNYSVKINVDIPAEEGMPTITVSPYEYIVLKDNLNAGQGWTQDVTQTTTFDIPGFPPVEMNIHYEGTILEKDVTAVVDGVTYNNVIKSKVTQTMENEDMFGNVTVTTFTSYMWFAKNIGPIRSQTETADSPEMNYVQTLSSYIIN